MITLTKHCSSKVQELNNQVDDLTTENKVLKKKIGDLETKSNKVFFANDALNQYSRHKSFCIHGIPEVEDSSKKNCAEEAVKIARIGFRS